MKTAVKYLTHIQCFQMLPSGKQDLDDIIPSILEPEGPLKAFRKNRARFTRLWRDYLYLDEFPEGNTIQLALSRS